VYNEGVAASPLLFRLRRLGLFVLRSVALAYCLILLLLLLLENTLLYPAPKYPEGDWTASYLPHEDVVFQSADGTKLHGWLVEHPNARAVLLYCHGNGDCVCYLGSYLRELRERHRVTVFAFDYRGYGKSEGSPGESGILADGDAAQRWLAERTGRRPGDIVLMGRSLGGGVVVDLAARNGACGLILQNTATSLPDAAARIYWFLPVHWLMKNRYDSLSKVGRYTGPLLMSHGTADTLIPFDLGQKLFAASSSSPKQFFPVEGAGHNDPEPPAYDVALEAFLASLH
jgi:fermentation-respiration switch protein FrsA (DUF1100 family)